MEFGREEGYLLHGFRPTKKPHLEDLAFTWTDAAQSVLHDTGTVLSSDSQAMSCVEEVVAQTWHTMRKMKTCMGLLVTHQCVVMGEWRGIMPRIRWVREHLLILRYPLHPYTLALCHNGLSASMSAQSKSESSQTLSYRNLKTLAQSQRWSSNLASSPGHR